LLLDSYQLAFKTPGISPESASLRKQIRHISNLRKYARGRPHRGQRLYARAENLGFRFAFTLNDSFAIK